MFFFTKLVVIGLAVGISENDASDVEKTQSNDDSVTSTSMAGYQENTDTGQRGHGQHRHGQHANPNCNPNPSYYFT